MKIIKEVSGRVDGVVLADKINELIKQVNDITMIICTIHKEVNKEK